MASVKPRFYKLVSIKFDGQEAKFKIIADSKSVDIQDTIRARFNIPSSERLVLVDDQDNADVVIDGLLETGSYHLYAGAPSCCPPGSWPALQAPSGYVPKGKWEKIGGFDFYVVGKKEGKQSAVFIASDIWGAKSSRHVQVADELALQGYLVVMPDFFGSDGWTDTSDWADLPAWVKKSPWEKISKYVHVGLEYLEKEGVGKIGAIGFCWGTWVVLKASATGKVAAGVNCHPSHQRVSGFLGESELETVNAVKAPQLFIPAGNDPESVKEGGVEHKAFQKNGIAVQYKEFPEMQHGWVVRSDVSEPKNLRDVKAALELAKSFFKKYL